MAAATLFAVPIGIAAMSLEWALRALGRQTRGPWLGALALAVVWPIVTPVVAALHRSAAADDAAVVLPAVRSTIATIAGALSPLPDTWILRLDTALMVLWAIASAVLLGRLLVAWRTLSVVERAASTDVIAGVPVLVTPTLGPAVFGLRHPRLLVPRWLLDLDQPLRALVLRHEQEHCRARDPQLTLAVAIAVALVPWNAGAWWIARRLRLAVELDCDARVLAGTGDPARYGLLLLLIAQRQAHTTLAPMLAESNSDLTRRITIMNAARPANPTTRAAVLALVAAAALACSTKYAADLTTSPRMSERRLSGQGPTYFLPKGATPVKPVPNSLVLRYPDSLRLARVEGEVLAQFVVDTSGQVDLESLRVLSSTHELFTGAVRAAVATVRFIPAQMNGRKIRQLVQEPFFFDLKGSPASAARKPAPAARPTSDSTNQNVMMLRPMVVAVP
jgi:TonB family protein